MHTYSFILVKFHHVYGRVGGLVVECPPALLKFLGSIPSWKTIYWWKFMHEHRTKRLSLGGGVKVWPSVLMFMLGKQKIPYMG